MKRLLLFFLVIPCVVLAQTEKTPPEKTKLITRSPADKTLSKVMELKFHSKSGGANGASIAWHPIQKKYYAAIAGNETFPLEVFDVNGNSLTDTMLSTMFDTRGLWYNSHSKTIQGNGYDDYGWIEYVTDEKGLLVYMRKIFSGMKQPDKQSAGVYDEAHNAVYFFDNVNLLGIERRNLKTGSVDSTFVIHYGAKTKEEVKLDEEFDLGESYNSTSFANSGIPGSEICLLNAIDLQIEYYNLKTGLLTKIVRLPEDAPADFSLNFCYTNGIFWLFDKVNRSWIGYK